MDLIYSNTHTYSWTGDQPSGVKETQVSVGSDGSVLLLQYCWEKGEEDEKPGIISLSKEEWKFIIEKYLDHLEGTLL